MNVDALHRELDRWHALGRRATLWLRDDDACRDSRELRRLLALAQARGAPIAIAAIPASLDATLVDAIGRCPRATVVQHGYAHVNHAAAGERSAELGDDRDMQARLDELARGRERLSRTFGDRFIPILVPPWNRIGEHLLPHLASAGFVGLSRFGPRASRDVTPGVLQVNAHVDAIAWKRDRRFIGADAAIERIVAHLSARREGACDAFEPTGFLTHHLVFDEPAFDFIDTLLDATLGHPAAEWLGVVRCFGAERVVTCVRSA